MEIILSCVPFTYSTKNQGLDAHLVPCFGTQQSWVAAALSGGIWGVPAVRICDMGVLEDVWYTTSHLKNSEILLKLMLHLKSVDYRKQFHRSQKLPGRFPVL